MSDYLIEIFRDEKLVEKIKRHLPSPNSEPSALGMLF